MADQPVTLDSIDRVVDVVTKAGLTYAFIGGVAMNTWAIPRATFDLDLAIAVSDRTLADLLHRFEAKGFVVDAEFRNGFRDRIAGMEKVHTFLPIGRSLLAVDLFLANTPFLESTLARRVVVDLGHGPIQICSAADLILFKLIAGRPKDMLDIKNLIVVQGIPEPSYLRSWASRLGLEERLKPLLERLD
jgi:hypothetical protein